MCDAFHCLLFNISPVKNVIMETTVLLLLIAVRVSRPSACLNRCCVTQWRSLTQAIQ